VRLDSSVVAVGLLVLLAGCGGLSGGAPTTADPGTAQSPPGVNETSVAPRELANAHGSTLSGAPYEANHTTRVTFANGTVYAERTDAGTVVDGDHYAVATERRGAWTPVGIGSRVSYYADGETLQRLVVSWSGDSSVSPVRENTPSAVERLGLGDDDRLYQLLTSADETRVSVDGTNETSVTLGGARPVAPSYVSEPGPANATLQITSEGVVTELVVRYEATVDGERVRVRTTVDYDAVGEATVERPDWVETDG